MPYEDDSDGGEDDHYEDREAAKRELQRRLERRMELEACVFPRLCMPYVRFQSPLQLGRQTSTVNCMCRLHEQERKAAARRRLGDLDAKLGVRNPHQPASQQSGRPRYEVCLSAGCCFYPHQVYPALHSHRSALLFLLAFAGCSTRAGQQPAPTRAVARVVLTEAQPIPARSNRRSHSENRHAAQSFTPPGTAVAFLPVLRTCSVRTWASWTG